MARSGLVKIFLAAVAVSAAAIASFSSVSAQYPETAGALNLTTQSFNANTNTNMPYVCLVTDQTGAPMVGVQCVITIIGEPGSDAAVGSKTVTRITDSEGKAIGNLFVGTTPGTITILAESQGLSSQAKVLVGGGVTPVSTGGTSTGSGSAPAASTTTGTSGVIPPRTGDAGLVAGATGSYALLALGGIFAVVLASALVLRPGIIRRR